MRAAWRSRENGEIELVTVFFFLVLILFLLFVFLSPCFSEGESNALLEAMSLCGPVVARNNSGNASLIHHGVTGWLFDTPQQMVEYAKKAVYGTDLFPLSFSSSSSSSPSCPLFLSPISSPFLSFSRKGRERWWKVGREGSQR